VTKERVTAAELAKARAVDAYWGGVRAAALRLQIRQLRDGRVLGPPDPVRAAIAAAEAELVDADALARAAAPEEIAAARASTKGGQRMAGLGEWLRGAALVEMVGEDKVEVVMRGGDAARAPRAV
jgi:hypothetical protein